MYRKKLLITTLCLLMAAALLSFGTLAWLSKTQTADTAYTTLSDFEVTGVLSFKDGAVYSGNSILAPVSFHSGEQNYIGDMKYVVSYTGASPAYIRVRILEQWTDDDANEILPAEFLNYKVMETGDPITPDGGDDALSIPAAGSGTENDALAEAGVWLDNRKSDYCYYYTVPVQPQMLSAAGTDAALQVGDGKVELTLINQDGDASLVQGIGSSAQMGLVIEVEAVQPNRYREFWGISAIPAPTL